MAMMNPQLAALLGQGQTAPPSVAGSPIVSAIQKMMGAGGSAPPMPQQMAQAAPQGNMPMPQSTAPNPVSTEEELAMAQKMMGAPRERPPMKRKSGREMIEDRSTAGQSAAERSLREDADDR